MDVLVKRDEMDVMYPDKIDLSERDENGCCVSR